MPLGGVFIDAPGIDKTARLRFTLTRYGCRWSGTKADRANPLTVLTLITTHVSGQCEWESALAAVEELVVRHQANSLACSLG